MPVPKDLLLATAIYHEMQIDEIVRVVAWLGMKVCPKDY